MNNLIPFKQYYQIYGDDHVTPLVYRIAGKRVPEELYETIMVDPTNGQVVLSPEDQRKLAMAPEQEALTKAQSLKDRILDAVEPGITAINNFRNQIPIISDNRMRMQQAHPLGTNLAQEGGNLAGNIILSVPATMIGGGALGTLYNALRAGQYASVVGALAGAWGGHELGDYAVQRATNGQYKGYADYMQREGGFWPYNTEMTNPASLLGGYAGSKVANGIALNAEPWFRNMSMQGTIRPDGYYEVYPEETSTKVTVPLKDGPYALGATKNDILPYMRNVRGGFQRTSGSARQAGRKQGPRQQGKTTGTPSDRLSDARNSNSKNSPTFEWQSPTYAPFNPLPWATSPMPPKNPPILIPPPTPIPDTQLKETTTGVDPFEEWFGKQIPGTRAYWPGDSNSAWDPGWIKIKWGRDVRAFSERGRRGVGKDNTGRDVGTPAKTYGRYSKPILGPVPAATRVEVLPGQLPNVELNPTETKIVYPE